MPIVGPDPYPQSLRLPPTPQQADESEEAGADGPGPKDDNDA